MSFSWLDAGRFRHHGVGALALLVSSLMFASSASAESEGVRSPYKTIVRGGLRNFFEAPLSKKFRTSLHTPEGILSLELVRKKMDSGRTRGVTAARYFRGRVLHRSGFASRRISRAVSAVNDSKGLRISLFGKRRGRSYVANIPATEFHKNHESVVGHLAHAPSVFPLGCPVGHASAQPPTVGGFAAEAAGSGAVYSPIKSVQLVTEYDYDFYINYISEEAANARILEIINSVNAIYEEQLGMTFTVEEQLGQNTSTQPYTNSDSLVLLYQFLCYRNALKSRSDVLSACSGYDSSGSDFSVEYDLAHLFTGKTLASSVIGLAFLGVTCQDLAASFGLTQLYTASVQHLVTAHELGHNFNAEHDSSGSYLMSPVINGSSTFSSTSLTAITAFVDSYGVCLSDGEASASIAMNSVRYRATSKSLVVKVDVSNLSEFAASTCQVWLYSAKTPVHLTTSTKGATAKRFARRTYACSAIDGTTVSIRNRRALAAGTSRRTATTYVGADLYIDGVLSDYAASASSFRNRIPNVTSKALPNGFR